MTEIKTCEEFVLQMLTESCEQVEQLRKDNERLTKRAELSEDYLKALQKDYNELLTKYAKLKRVIKEIAHYDEGAVLDDVLFRVIKFDPRVEIIGGETKDVTELLELIPEINHKK